MSKVRFKFVTLVLAIALFAPVLSFSQATAAVSTPASAPSKIAFVNLQEAVGTCNEGKQEAAALQQRFSAKQAALKAQDDELKKLKDDFQIASGKLSEDQRTTRLKVIQDKQKAFERSYADFQAETQEAQQEAVNKIMRKMLPVLEKYVLANGYTAVLDVSNPQTPVIWARKEAMITEALVSAYNAQPQSAAPAPGAARNTPPKR